MMVGMFDRWFAKRPDTEEADQIIKRSVNELSALASSHQAAWGFGKLDNWNVDLAKGFVRFSSADGFEALAQVQVVGTFNTLDNTFLWAWDHPSIPAERAQAVQLTREFGQKYGLIDYSTRKVACDQETAWEYAAVTNHLANMQGAYRGPSGATLIFMTFGELTLSNKSEM